MKSENTSSIVTLFHGSQNEIVSPSFGFGNDKRDFGKGFYLTADSELAKEWAVCRPGDRFGWVHKYYLQTSGLKIMDFGNESILSWLAELMTHRNAADSKRYQMLSKKFIDKYAIQTDGFDVVKGWRANASYFYIAKAFVLDEVDVDFLEELLSLGELGIQFCLKSEKAFQHLSEDMENMEKVDFLQYNDKYNQRDISARERMRVLIDSDRNKVTNVFSTLI